MPFFLNEEDAARFSSPGIIRIITKYLIKDWKAGKMALIENLPTLFDLCLQMGFILAKTS